MLRPNQRKILLSVQYERYYGNQFFSSCTVYEMAISPRGNIVVTTDLGEILVFERIEELQKPGSSRQSVLLSKFEKVIKKIILFFLKKKKNPILPDTKKKKSRSRSLSGARTGAC